MRAAEGTLVAVGRFVGVFGVRGEFKCKPTPAGELTLATGGSYALTADGSGRRLAFAELRRVSGRMIVRVAGIDSIETATPLAQADLYLERERIVLDPGEFLDEDLIGLRLVDPYGAEVGIVASIEHYPTQDCFVLAGRRGMVPMVKAFVKRIDLGDRTVLVTLPEGLLEGA